MIGIDIGPGLAGLLSGIDGVALAGLVKTLAAYALVGVLGLAALKRQLKG